MTQRMTRKQILRALGITGMGTAAYYFAGVMLSINPDGPPREDVRINSVDVPLSTVFVPIDLPFDLVETLTMSAIGGTSITSGTSTRLITDAIFGLIPVLEPPEPKRVCTTQTITEAVERDVKCSDLRRLNGIGDLPGALTKCALSIGNASVNVVVNVAREVTECSIVETASQAVSPIPELSYDITLTGVDLRMAGEDVRVDLNLMADLDLGFQGRLLNTVIPNADSTCKLPIDAVALAAVTVDGTDRALRLDATLNDMTYTFDRGACEGALDGTIDFSELEELLEGPIGDTVQPAIRAASQRALYTQFGNPLAPDDVASAMRSVDALLSAPIAIPQTPVTLALEPEALLLSETLAMGNAGPEILRIQAGLQARPRLVVLDTPEVTDTEVPVTMVAKQPEGFTVVPVAEVPLRLISDEATQVIRSYLEEVAPGLMPIDLSVVAYQSDRRVVLGVEAKGITWLNFSANVYLTGQPSYDPITREVKLTAIKFDAASSEALINRAAWFIEGPVEHLLETNLRFPPDTVFQEIVAALSDITFEHEAGQVRIALEDFKMQEFWVDDGALKLAVAASGEASLSTILTEIPVIGD